MTKHIFRQVPPEQADLSSYFDDDGLTEAGGDYCYNLFIVAQSRHSSGFNEEEYKRIQDKADAIIDGFSDVSDKWTNGYNSYETYKECMEYNAIEYTTHKCHALKEWAKTADISDTDSIAEFLTITTGKQWSTDSARGYSQGDYVEGVYCTEAYKDGIQNYLEIWLGAGKEFSFITLDENGEEVDEVYAYIVADSEANDSKELKALLCKWEGVPEEETELQMISGSRTYTAYEYEIS